MALQINFPDLTDGICENAYVLADLTLDNKTKTGRIELAVWKQKEYRDGAKQKINNVDIPIGTQEIWFTKQQESEEQVDIFPDYEVGENIYVTALAWDDFAWKTGEDVYAKIKTLRVYTEGVIIDLSESVDC
jgi:hypothetical protein